MDGDIYTNLIEEFSNSINELLIENNLTVEEFSKKAQINPSVVYLWLAQKYLGSTRNVLKIADTYKCSIDFLLGFATEKYYLKSTKNETFYMRLITLKNSKGIGYRDFESVIGIKSENLTKWKHGKLPNIETIVRLSKYFQCSTDFILGRAD